MLSSMPIFVFCICVSTRAVLGVLTETRKVAGFAAIDLRGPFITVVEITGSEGVTIEANLEDKNIINAIQTVVTEKSLRLLLLPPYDKDDGKLAGLIRIKVTGKDDLHSFVNGGSGSMDIVSLLTARSISIVNQGSGKMTCAVKTDNFNAVTSGSGAIKVGGITNSCAMSISGDGSIEASELDTQTVSVALYGSGNVTLNAQVMLSAMTMGAGSIFYRGPATVSQMKMGTGSVIKLD